MSRNKRIMTVDVGNTSAKLTVMEGPDSVVSVTVPEVTQGAVTGMLQDTGAEGMISCSVGPDISGILAAVCASRDLPYVSLDADTPVPVQVDYNRAGLGADRLAAAVGVAEPDRCWLIADAGTALTLDMTRGMTFAGGSIAPGMNMRFESLHSHTRRLPLVSPEGSAPLFARDTAQAIRSGVIRGMAYETMSALGQFRQFCPEARLCVTGGDAPVLSRQLTIMNVPHTVCHNAVARGLVKIFNYCEPLREK